MQADDLECGDKIVCISNEENDYYLTVGEIYTVSEIDPSENTVMIEEEESEWYPLEIFARKGSKDDNFQRESIKDCVTDFVKSVPKRSKNAGS